MEQTDFSNHGIKQKLPNATPVLILGIASIISCCCYGIGLVFAIVALVLAKKDLALYKTNPQNYLNYSNLNTGKILAIIGLVLNILYLGYVVWILCYFGIEALQNPELMQQRIQELIQ
jgi:type IV secretory pathway TrbD component